MQKLNKFKIDFDDNDISCAIDLGNLLAQMDSILHGEHNDIERESSLHFFTQLGLSEESPIAVLFRAYKAGYYAGLDEGETDPAKRISDLEKGLRDRE